MLEISVHTRDGSVIIFKKALWPLSKQKPFFSDMTQALVRVPVVLPPVQLLADTLPEAAEHGPSTRAPVMVNVGDH